MKLDTPKIIMGEAKLLFVGENILWLKNHKCTENVLKSIEVGKVADYNIIQNQPYLGKNL